MSKRVRTLLRVSSRQQLHDDDIPIQRAEAERYIAGKNDWIFDKEYMEKAVSAYKNSVEDREILQEILADAKKKEFDILLTYMSDRIGRKEEYSFYVATLNQLGIEVWTIKDGQLKTQEHVDKLLNFIRFWQNEGESRKTGMRVRDAQKEMAREGKFVGGKAPFGYRLVLSGEISSHGRALHKLEILPQKAAVVQKIYSYAVHQGMGAERIAKRLNEENIPAITTDVWKSATIAGILKNPVYMGYPAIGRRASHTSPTRTDRGNWTYAKEQIPELVLVSQRDWERAQELREARKKKTEAVPFRTSGKLPLIGFTYCGYCGKKLKNASYYNKWYSKREKKEKVSFAGRYSCANRCEGGSRYTQKYLESIVFEVIDAYLAQFEAVSIAEEIRNRQRCQRSFAEKELQRLKKRHRSVTQDIDTLYENLPQALRGDYVFSAEKLAELIESRKESLRELTAAVSQKEAELSLLTDAGSEEQQELIQRKPDWKEEFAAADTATKQMLLSLLIERIEVRTQELTIRFRISREDFYPR